MEVASAVERCGERELHLVLLESLMGIVSAFTTVAENTKPSRICTGVPKLNHVGKSFSYSKTHIPLVLMRVFRVHLKVCSGSCIARSCKSLQDTAPLAKVLCNMLVNTWSEDERFPTSGYYGGESPI
jgi:hypothetical protein